jgi:hypothetical protein
MRATNSNPTNNQSDVVITLENVSGASISFVFMLTNSHLGYKTALKTRSLSHLG